MIPLIDRLWTRVLEWLLPTLVVVIDAFALAWIWLVQRIGTFGAWLIFVWVAVVAVVVVSAIWAVTWDAWHRWWMRRRLRIVYRRETEKDAHMRKLAQAIHGGPSDAA